MVLIRPNDTAFNYSRMMNICNGRKLSVVGEKEGWSKACFVVN